jgi:hypothetical protein
MKKTQRHKTEAHNNSYMKHLGASLALTERKLNFSVMIIIKTLLKE